MGTNDVAFPDPRMRVKAAAVLTMTASTRTDLALLAVATVAAVLSSLAIGAMQGIELRAASAAVGIALTTVPFALMRRLELALYSFVPLLTVVGSEPAPVDFMAIGLLGALALRRSLRGFVPPRVELIGFALLVISYGFALALAPSDRSLTYAATTLVVGIIGYVAYQLAARGPRVAEHAFVIAGAVLTLQAVIALLPLGIAGDLRENALRIQGLFKDPNEFGSFAVPGVVLLCMRWPALSPVIRIAGLGALLLPVVASFSRAALLVLFVALIVLAAIAAYRRLRKVFVRCIWILATGILGIAVATLVGSNSIASNITAVVHPYDSQRLAGQVAGVRQVLEHPAAAGVGPGNYELVLGLPSDGTYLRILVETGPVGLLGLLLVLWGAVRLLRVPDLGAVAWASALAGFAVCGLFIDTIHWRHLWVMVGLALAAAAYRDHHAAQRLG